MSEMKINRRGFIALSASAFAAIPLARLQETWVHRGIPVTVRRKGNEVAMQFKVNSTEYGLGTILSDRRPNVENALRRAIKFTIDEKTGYNERWLANQKTRFARMVA